MFTVVTLLKDYVSRVKNEIIFNDPSLSSSQELTLSSILNQFGQKIEMIEQNESKVKLLKYEILQNLRNQVNFFSLYNVMDE